MLLVGSGLVGLGFFKRRRKREVLSWEIYGEGKKMVYWLKMGIWTLNIAFIVILATNSIEGVKKAIQEKPDLILMDILMPKMDGRDATRIIRTNRETRDIRIEGGDDFKARPQKMEKMNDLPDQDRRMKIDIRLHENFFIDI